MFLSFLREHKYLLAHTIIAILAIWLIAMDRFGFDDNSIATSIFKSILLSVWMLQLMLAVVTINWHETSLRKGLDHLYGASVKDCLTGIALVIFVTLNFMILFPMVTALFLGTSLALTAVLFEVAILTRESQRDFQDVPA